MEVTLTQWMVLVLVGVLVASVLRVIPDSQRVSTRLFGHQWVTKGPGFVVRIPVVHQEWRIHRIGDQGVMVTAQQAEFQRIVVAVDTHRSPQNAGQAVRVVAFAGLGRKSHFVVEAANAPANSSRRTG